MVKKVLSEDLQLCLDSRPSRPKSQSSTFYSPGQSILGKAIYTPKVQVDIDSVVVVFRCALHTEISTGRQIYRDRMDFFRYEQILFQGPHTVPPKELAWQFTFRLPERLHIPGKSDPQPLPPTWNDYQTARISYTLELTVNPDRAAHSARVCRSINVWPFTATAPPNPVSIYCSLHETLGSSRRVQKYLSCHRLTRQLFSFSHTGFQVTIRMPDTVTAWQPFSVEVACWNTQGDGAKSQSPDELTLGDCEIILRANIEHRDCPSSRNEIGRPRLCSILMTSRSDRRIYPDGSFNTLGEACLAGMTQQVHSLTPNFEAGAISLSYLMDVSIRMLHPRSGYSFEYKGSIPFTVLPSAIPRSELVAESLSSISPCSEPDEMPPPTYCQSEAPPIYAS